MSKRPQEDTHGSLTMEPTPKRRGDRVVLDVGGRKFVTSVVTLESNSTYFHSLFSRHWVEHNDDCFVDQNSDAFAVILDYMREHFIDIEAINTKVLLQIEYLGVESLLTAVKVKMHCNMNPAFSGTEEDAVHSFDKKYGGIKNAIGCGDLPKYLLERVEGEKDYAIFEYLHEEYYSFAVRANDLPRSLRFSFIGAMDCLHFHGYTKCEENMKWGNRNGDKVSFSREKHSIDIPSKFPCTQILLEQNRSKTKPKTKSFALCVSDNDSLNFILAAPNDEDEEVPEEAGNPGFYTSIRVDCPLTWLQTNGYDHREKEMEETFKAHILLNLETNGWLGPDRFFQMYSRELPELTLKFK